MARRRNREINIFNMSLLDILCGALGAFCFMMLALLPYYKPPGPATDSRESQQKLQEKMQQVDEASKKMGDSPAVEDLRKLVEELKKQIQEIQGQLNQALAKVEDLQDQLKKTFAIIDELTKQNDNLTAQNAALADENAKLKEMLKKMTSADALAAMQKRIEQLEQQLQQSQSQLSQIKAANDELRDKNDELDDSYTTLRDRVKDLKPISLFVTCTNDQMVDIFVEEVALDQSSSEEKRAFDPGLSRSLVRSSSDTYLFGSGYAVYMIPETPQKTEYRLFVKLLSSPEKQVASYVNVSILYLDQDRKILDVTPQGIQLTPERPWSYFGRVRKQSDRSVSFLLNDGERDAYWKKIGPAKNPPISPQQASPTPPTTATTIPSATPTRANVSATPRLFPARPELPATPKP